MKTKRVEWRVEYLSEALKQWFVYAAGRSKRYVKMEQRSHKKRFPDRKTQVVRVEITEERSVVK